MNSQDYKRRALDQLKGHWGQVILMCFLANLIIGVSSLLFYGVMTTGMAIYFSRFVRTGDTTLENSFKGFQDFGGTFLLGLLENIFIFLWSLLLIIPGIIKSYSYSAAFYIKANNRNYSAMECIEASKDVMDGKKLDLFLLDLSFIGWALLCAVPTMILVTVFGINQSNMGFVLTALLTSVISTVSTLFLVPYMETARANFFHVLLAEKGLLVDSIPQTPEPPKDFE